MTRPPRCRWCNAAARYRASDEPGSGLYACGRHIARALDELLAGGSDLRVLVDPAN